MFNRMEHCAWTALLTLAAATSLPAAVKVPALISDHMVVQQGVPVRIWGTADAGEAVKVAVNGQAASTKANDKGKWEAWLKPMIPGGPYEMTISGSNTIAVQDVLVGEVWVGSGQSNMQWPVNRSVNSAQEIAAAQNPKIRLFYVKRTESDTVLDDVEGKWQLCTPESVPEFSAVLYFFGRELYKHRGVPMGLIHSSWGGTPAEAWTSREGLNSDPRLKFIQDDWAETMAKYPAAKAEFDRKLAEWPAAEAKAKAEGKPAPRKPGPPMGPGSSHTPTGLYNAMIAPLTPYAIRGAIWYQGESNASDKHAYPYRRLFRTMIEDWRQAWGIGDFPFLFVQLANFKANPNWPVLRESQTETLGLRNTGMAVIIDIGESTDIHPKNKQDVGSRLSLAARKIAYGEDLEYSGPMYRQATSEGSALRVWFDHADGLAARGGGAVTGFTVAGADGNYVPADARIEGSTVVVSSPSVAMPVNVRYAWADDPVSNLVNGTGLPASPFRSDAPRR